MIKITELSHNLIQTVQEMGQFIGHNFIPADILASDNENEIEAYLANPLTPYTKLGKKILGSLQQFDYKTEVAFQQEPTLDKQHPSKIIVSLDFTKNEIKKLWKKEEN